MSPKFITLCHQNLSHRATKTNHTVPPNLITLCHQNSSHCATKLNHTLSPTLIALCLKPGTPARIVPCHSRVHTAQLRACRYDVTRHFEYERSRGVHSLSMMGRAMGGPAYFAALSPSLLLHACAVAAAAPPSSAGSAPGSSSGSSSSGGGGGSGKGREGSWQEQAVQLQEVLAPGVGDQQGRRQGPWMKRHDGPDKDCAAGAQAGTLNQACTQARGRPAGSQKLPHESVAESTGFPPAPAADLEGCSVEPNGCSPQTSSRPHLLQHHRQPSWLEQPSQQASGSHCHARPLQAHPAAAVHAASNRPMPQARALQLEGDAIALRSGLMHGFAPLAPPRDVRAHPPVPGLLPPGTSSQSSCVPGSRTSTAAARVAGDEDGSRRSWGDAMQDTGSGADMGALEVVAARRLLLEAGVDEQAAMRLPPMYIMSGCSDVMVPWHEGAQMATCLHRCVCKAASAVCSRAGGHRQGALS